MLRPNRLTSGFVWLTIGLIPTGCREATTPVPTPPTTVRDIAYRAKSQLESDGWNTEAARAVVTQNLSYLEILFDEDRDQFERTLALWARLADHPYVQQCLVQMPELAGLLAGTLEHAADGPERVLRTIPHDVPQDRDAVYSLYGLSAEPGDCLEMAEILEANRDIVLRLFERGAVDGFAWFAQMPKDEAVAKVYRDWLRSVLEQALNDADEEALDRAQTLLTIHAPTIREKLSADAEFRQSFLRKHWLAFHRTLAQQKDDLSWGIFVGEPRVWDFFVEFGNEGQRLFSTHGPLAVDLLMAAEYRDCRKQVLQALTIGNELTIQSLYDTELRRQPLFVQLLEKELPGGTMAKALNELAARPAEIPQLLSYWNGLSDSALIEDLGPPPAGPQTWLPGYSLYYLGKKRLEGREITGMDIVAATADTVEVVFMLKGTGKGLKLIQHGLKEGLAKRGLREAAENVTQLSARELYPWVLREGHRTARTALRAVRQQATVDVTGIVQFAFQKTGLGRKTFRRFTGLEARVFMRADRRVAVDLAALVQHDHIVGRMLRESAVNAGFDLSLGTEPGDAAADSVIVTTLDAAQRADEQWQAWRTHLAIWWLATNDGSLAEAKEAGSQQNIRPEGTDE